MQGFLAKQVLFVKESNKENKVAQISAVSGNIRTVKGCLGVSRYSAAIYLIV